MAGTFLMGLAAMSFRHPVCEMRIEGRNALAEHLSGTAPSRTSLGGIAAMMQAVKKD
jgi:hypothetical protein